MTDHSEPVARDNHNWEAALVRRSWLRRVIQITGCGHHTVEFDALQIGIGRDVEATVRVNGAPVPTTVQRTSPLVGFWQEHAHSLSIPDATGRVSVFINARVDRTGLLVQLTQLTLFVNN